jgi:hypothetical protein
VTALFLDASRLHIFWKDTGHRIEAGFSAAPTLEAEERPAGAPHS